MADAQSHRFASVPEAQTHKAQTQESEIKKSTSGEETQSRHDRLLADGRLFRLPEDPVLPNSFISGQSYLFCLD